MSKGPYCLFFIFSYILITLLIQFAEAVAFLHDLGSLQHFSGNEYLQSKVVVNPQWIVDVMACVVSVKESPIKVRVYNFETSLYLEIQD